MSAIDRRRIPLRPIVEDWHCAKSGECCRATPAIRMTVQEAAVLLERTVGRDLRWRVSVPSGWVELIAGPCPLLEGNRCTVYDVRPYQCRRFQCHRAPGEVFDPSGPLGCANLSERLTQDRETRRAYALNQRKAMKWANRHGWTGQET